MAIRRTNGNGGNGASNDGGSAVAEAPARGVANDSPSFRENAEVNAKIDGYIEKNPKEWAYIQSLPRERLERSVVLDRVQAQDRREKMQANVLRKLDANPELKASVQELVNKMPPEKQQAALVRFASQALRSIAPPAQTQAQGARV